MEDEKKPDVGGGDKKETSHINLRVVWQDGGEVFFKIKRSTKMSKLFQAYCKREGKDEGSVRFLYDGEVLNPTDTPESLAMDDNDMIDAMQFQVGGC